jgi:FdhE protein
MPPIARERFEPDAGVLAALDRLFDMAGAVAMPDQARAALDGLARSDEETRRDLIFSALADAPLPDRIAEHVFVSAGLQVSFARMAATLDPQKLVGVADGACPACGGPPASSMVVGWPGAHGARYCACFLCATQWHVVRAKCVLCSSTKGVTYQEIEGVSDTIKAETCSECRGYLKILYQMKEPALDPVADDVASLGLDMLVREAGWRRGGVNAFLTGF